MTSPTLAFVSVVFEAEFGLLGIQARSMARYLPVDATDEIIVIDNSRRGMPAPLVRRLLEDYGPHASHVSILRSDDITKVRGAVGWRTQQVLKLLVATRLRAERFVLLDAKNHFVGQWSPSLFEAPDGRMLVGMSAYDTHPLRRDLEHVLRYLHIDPAQHVGSFTSTVTPFVLSTALVRELITEIEASSGRSFTREFVKNDLTEFFVYAGWLLNHSPSLMEVYATGLKVGPTVWPRGATVAGVTSAIEAVTAGGHPMFAVHRMALSRLDADAAALLAAFWAERGLFDSLDAATSFVREFPAMLAREQRAQKRADLPSRVWSAPRAIRRKIAAKLARRRSITTG